MLCCLSVFFVVFFARLFLLLLVTDECFMAPWPLAHGLDAVMGPSHSRKTALKQTDIVIMPGKGLWCSTKQCGYLCAAFPRKSGATSLQERPLHQSSHDPHWWLSQWKPSCMFFLFSLDSEITTQNNGGARPQPRLIWTHLVHFVQLLLDTLLQFAASMLFIFKKSKKDKWKEC